MGSSSASPRDATFRPVEIISEFELLLLKDYAFQQRLGSFSRWEQESSPAETDLNALEKSLET